MHKSIFKKVPPKSHNPSREVSQGEKTHRSEVFNQQEDECRWPYNVFGQVEDCAFVHTIVATPSERAFFEGSKEKLYSIVQVPKGTLFYHSTQLLGFGSSKWWENNYPMDTAHGGVWFTSTQRHASNFTTKTHTLVYVTKEKSCMIFVKNLTKFGEGVRGFEFVSRHYAQIKDEAKTMGYEISGYLSCNECEIFLENDTIPQVLEKEPGVASERSSAYID